MEHPGQLAYTVDEAQRVARVGRTLIYEAMARGDLVSIAIGRKRLIPVHRLREWLDRHEQPAHTPVARPARRRTADRPA